MAIGKHQNHKRTVRRKADEFDVADRCVLFGRQDNACPACHGRQGCADVIQERGDIFFAAGKCCVHNFAVFGGNRSNLKPRPALPLRVLETRAKPQGFFVALDELCY